ncbi:MAG: ThuA domain-containing protein [Akkermansiaceae bacterium]|nr:ThuA domain-containing protein [Akkermansiaceae bacterium]
MKKTCALLLPVAVALAMLPAVIGEPATDAPTRDRIKAALPDKAFAAPKEKRKLLVFSVTNGFRHGSIPTGQAALGMLGEQTGAYEAVVSNDLAHFESDRIGQFDAICFLNTTGDVFAPYAKGKKKEFDALPAAEKKAAEARAQRLFANLMAFVKGGKGFIGIHSATDTLYNQPEYGEMMNGYFWGHPWNAGTPVSIKVEPGQENHPIVKHLGGKNMDFKEEIYQLKDPYDSKKVRMLLRLDPTRSKMDVRGIKRTDADFGVSWIREWGEGRVFYCSLGHNDHIYWNPDVLKVYLGGIQWALGDWEVPVQ